MAEYISGDKSRVFVNPVLGCDSNCSYCYLGSQGLELGKKTAPPMSSDFLIDGLLSFPGFVKGRYGSIVSVGCYSECWSRSNVSVTKEFLSKALDFGNPIQFATKREVLEEQLAEISGSIKWSGQLSLFISCSSISKWNEYEKGTSRPIDRFKHISKLISLGVMVCLYIKPVIDSVTLADLSLFCDVIEREKCAVVVGESFSYDSSGSKEGRLAAPIPSFNLFIESVSDRSMLLEAFRERGYIVFESSVNAVNYWRQEIEHQ